MPTIQNDFSRLLQGELQLINPTGLTPPPARYKDILNLLFPFIAFIIELFFK